MHDVDEEDKRVGDACACRPLTSELQRFFKVMTGAQSDRQTDRAERLRRSLTDAEADCLLEVN